MADSNLPVCVGAVCVQCDEDMQDACAGTTPICDTAENTCVGCFDHDQCTDSACNFDEGYCFDQDASIHVDGGAVCANADGTDAAPFCTIEDALEAAVDGTLIILHENPIDPLVYVESNTISVSIAIFALPNEEPSILGVGGNPAIRVAASGKLFMRGVTIAGTQNSTEGLRAVGGSAWIEQSKIVNNTGGGIVVSGGGSLTLENCFVGGDQSDQNALHIVDGTATITYSTLAAGFGDAAALLCDAGTDTTIRNSLLVARTDTDELACPNITASNNAMEMSTPGNTSLGDMQTSWFIDYAAANFHLNPGMYPAEIETAATWTTGDPTTDIDNDPRPDVNGTNDFAGADVAP